MSNAWTSEVLRDVGLKVVERDQEIMIATPEELAAVVKSTFDSLADKLSVLATNMSLPGMKTIPGQLLVGICADLVWIERSRRAIAKS